LWYIPCKGDKLSTMIARNKLQSLFDRYPVRNLWICLMVLMAIQQLSPAAEVRLKNGSVLKGSIVSENDNFIILDSDGSKLNIAKGIISTIDGAAYAARPAPVAQPSPVPAPVPQQPSNDLRFTIGSTASVTLTNGAVLRGTVDAVNASYIILDVNRSKLNIMKSMIAAVDGKQLTPQPAVAPAPVAAAASSQPASAVPPHAESPALPSPAAAPVTPTPKNAPVPSPAAPTPAVPVPLSPAPSPSEKLPMPDPTSTLSAAKKVEAIPVPGPTRPSAVVAGAHKPAIPDTAALVKPVPPSRPVVAQPSPVPRQSSVAEQSPTGDSWEKEDAFTSSGPEAIKKLTENLRSPIPLKRMKAVLGLRRYGENASLAVSSLIRLLPDSSTTFDPRQEKDSTIRANLKAPSSMGAEALKTLVTIGKPAVKSLITALNDGNDYVRLQTVTALGSIDLIHAVKPLSAMLKDTSRAVRESAVHALSGIRDAEVFIPLLKDKTPEIRIGIIGILATIKDPRCVEPLVRMLTDRDSNVREKAAFALGEMRDSSTVTELMAALSDDISFVRRNAVEALGKIGDTRAIKPLTDLRKDESGYVQEAVVRVLKKLVDIEFVKHDKDVGSLIEALKHESPEIREKAANTLWLRTGQNFGADYDKWKKWQESNSGGQPKQPEASVQPAPSAKPRTKPSPARTPVRKNGGT
jgi:HEAT repeat protein/sRNA-binding regulator protein Hfq